MGPITKKSVYLIAMILCASALAAEPGQDNGDEALAPAPQKPLTAIRPSQQSPGAARDLDLATLIQLPPPAHLGQDSDGNALASAYTRRIPHSLSTPALDKFNRPDQAHHLYSLLDDSQRSILVFVAVGTVLFEWAPKGWMITARTTTAPAHSASIVDASHVHGVPVVHPFSLSLRETGTPMARIGIQFLRGFKIAPDYAFIPLRAARALSDNAVIFGPIVPPRRAARNAAAAPADVAPLTPPVTPSLLRTALRAVLSKVAACGRACGRPCSKSGRPYKRA